MTTTTAGNGAATTAEREFVREPQQVLRKRIGSTTYIVHVVTGPSATETMEDVLLRLIEREVQANV